MLLVIPFSKFTNKSFFYHSYALPILATPFPRRTLSQTLVLVYVTIPAREHLPADALLSPACLAYYSVREIVVRRFIPARMRDENAR